MASYKNIFKITHNDVLPIQGSILIAEPFLQDAYFQRSVVLLIEHTEHGSMGFVLNKKTDLIVNSFFKEFAEFPEIPIYLGGPVSPNRLFFIHSLGDNIIPDALKINDYLYFDGDFNALKRYILNGHPIDGKVKFFLGYYRLLHPRPLQRRVWSIEEGSGLCCRNRRKAYYCIPDGPKGN